MRFDTIFATLFYSIYKLNIVEESELLLFPKNPIMNGLSNFSQAADIWSLGVTLFSLVYGKVPFHDENILALYNKIRTQDLSIPEDPDISPELKDLIRRMLVKNPLERINLEEIKDHDWVTGYTMYPMSSEVENCRHLIEVTDNEVDHSVHSVPKLDTLILVKAMISNKSFANPFGSQKKRGQNTGVGRCGNLVERSNSAPDAYDILNVDRYVKGVATRKGFVTAFKKLRS